jgi:esterase/lipase superfamily enzyme
MMEDLETHRFRTISIAVIAICAIIATSVYLFQNLSRTFAARQSDELERTIDRQEERLRTALGLQQAELRKNEAELRSALDQQLAAIREGFDKRDAELRNALNRQQAELETASNQRAEIKTMLGTQESRLRATVDEIAKQQPTVDLPRREPPPPTDSSAPPPDSSATLSQLTAGKGTVAIQEIVKDLIADPHAVDMFFAASRKAEISASKVTFTSERSEDLSFGSLRVRIPGEHKIGRIELPKTRNFILFKLTQSVDEKKHFVLRDITILSQERFVELVKSSEKKHALVFVHGFNNTFEESAFRLAQMVFDMNYKGLPVLFSWASASGISGYRHDIDSALHARNQFVTLLRILQDEADIETIHIVAHSMGNVVVMEALDRIAGERLPLRVGELVLAAPDVSRDIFIQLAARVGKVAKGMTLYASSKDKALAASKMLALDIPRAGDVPSTGPIVLPGMDTIDVSAFGEEFLGLDHDTFASNRSLVDDIARLLLLGQRPPGTRTPQLRGRPEANNPPLYWLYPN